MGRYDLFKPKARDPERGYVTQIPAFMDQVAADVDELEANKAPIDHIHEGDGPIIVTRDAGIDTHTLKLAADGTVQKQVAGVTTATLATTAQTVYARVSDVEAALDDQERPGYALAEVDGYGDDGPLLASGAASGVRFKVMAPVAGKALTLVLGLKMTSAAGDPVRFECAYAVRRASGVVAKLVMPRHAPLTAYSTGDQKVPSVATGYQYEASVGGTTAGPGLTYTDHGQQFGQSWINCMADKGGGAVVAGTGSSGKILLSSDYGKTWSDRGQQAGQSQIYALAYLGNGILLAGTAPGGLILRSVDGGLTWTNMGQQGGASAASVLAYLGNGVVLAGTTNGHITRSADYGQTWSDLGQMFGQAEIKALCSVGGGVALAGTGNGGKILRSTDSGATWSDLGQQASQTAVQAFLALGGGVVLAGAAGHLLKSTNYGQTWADQGVIATSTGIANFINLGGGVLLAGAAPNARLLRSTDSGSNWTDLGSIITGALYIVSTVWLGGSRVLIGTGNGHVWGSNPVWPATGTVVDGTVTWNTLGAGLKPVQGLAVWQPPAAALEVAELAITIPGSEIIAARDVVSVVLRRVPRGWEHAGSLLITRAERQAVEA